jgi:hypothetical protein
MLLAVSGMEDGFGHSEIPEFSKSLSPNENEALNSERD